MRDLIRTFAFFLVFLGLAILSTKEISSQIQKPVSVDSQIFYNLKSESYVEVLQKIKITNQAPEVFIKDYYLFLKSINPENIEVREKEINYPFYLKRDEDGYILEINFPDTRVGKGNSREFEIKYSTSSLIKKVGDIWEVYIPKLASDNIFDTYDIQIIAPKSFGKLAYFSKNPTGKYEDEESTIVYFNKEQIEKDSVSLGFGNFQIFSFTIHYNLENPLEKETRVKIAIPPDSSYQRVFYESIDPQPQKIETDNDGNWLATFKLKPREKTVVIAKGYAQVYPEPYPLYQPSRENLIKNTKEDKYWEINDDQIKSIASGLKSVEDVYRFVVNNLDYSYERTTGKTERFGAKKALERKNEALCTEFTDLFIALLRAKGIPAREVNGYALSDDPKIKPLSLTKDILHAWPEYWDERKKVWVAVDPTWEKTKGGMDYFQNNDLKHFAFVFHGESSTQPLSPGSYKFGTNPSKDIFITLGGKPEIINKKIEINTQIVNTIPLIKYKLIIKISNRGQSAVYNDYLKISFDSKTNYEERIDSILPFSESDSEYAIIARNPLKSSVGMSIQ